MNILPVCPSAMTDLISAIQVGTTTGLSHHHWPPVLTILNLYLFYNLTMAIILSHIQTQKGDKFKGTSPETLQ
jgi:hypothetical protein